MRRRKLLLLPPPLLLHMFLAFPQAGSLAVCVATGILGNSGRPLFAFAVGRWRGIGETRNRFFSVSPAASAGGTTRTMSSSVEEIGLSAMTTSPTTRCRRRSARLRQAVAKALCVGGVINNKIERLHASSSTTVLPAARSAPSRRQEENGDLCAGGDLEKASAAAQRQRREEPTGAEEGNKRKRKTLEEPPALSDAGDIPGGGDAPAGAASSTKKKKKEKKKTQSTSDSSSKVAAAATATHAKKPTKYSKLLSSYLDRPRERELLLGGHRHRGEEFGGGDGLRGEQRPVIRHVCGVDEAGRGPLAGPVVAAAAIVPADVEGVVDSKKLTKEPDREAVYERIVSSPGVRWAVAVVDARTIDEINILQATLLAMRMATESVLAAAVSLHQAKGQDDPRHNCDEQLYRVATEASCSHVGNYVVCSSTAKSNNNDGKVPTPQQQQGQRAVARIDPRHAYALVDGNKLPTDMPCLGETVVKGDSKEYSIAAASVLAKVTRDRIMAEYDDAFPQYGWRQNKGYPSAAHVKAIQKFGAAPIHRRTFAPLKNMDFHDDGSVVLSKKKEKKKRRLDAKKKR